MPLHHLESGILRIFEVFPELSSWNDIEGLGVEEQASRLQEP